jgi:hypothetical protein
MYKISKWTIMHIFISFENTMLKDRSAVNKKLREQHFYAINENMDRGILSTILMNSFHYFNGILGSVPCYGKMLLYWGY